MNTYSLQIKTNSIRGFVQVRGVKLCPVMDSYKKKGFDILRIIKIKNNLKK